MHGLCFADGKEKVLFRKGKEKILYFPENPLTTLYMYGKIRYQKRIEAHLMKSIARKKAPRLCGKGVGAEVNAVGSVCWQLGEHPPCCRRNAESYQIRAYYVRIICVR